MVPPEELVKITQMEEGDLIGLHRSLGMWIRNNFGLWKGNKTLLQEAGKRDPDDASQVIVTSLWRSLTPTRGPIWAVPAQKSKRSAYPASQHSSLHDRQRPSNTGRLLPTKALTAS